MKRLNLIIVVILTILSVLILVTGCSSNSSSSITNSPSASSSQSTTVSPITSPPVSNPEDIPAIAGPILENILVSLNNDDYAEFSKDFSSTARNSLNQTAFDQLYSLTQTAIGDYQSKLYFDDTVQNGTITVLYVARYSKEPAGVSVTLILQSANEIYKVNGLNFDSPNLRGQPIDLEKLLAYADPETENVLVSLNNNDYSGFSKDMDQAMKNAIPALAFNGLYNQIKSTVGDYQSKEFESASMQDSTITLRYFARYTDEPSGVWVVISFDNNQKISGLYFTSPKLKQAQ